MADQLPVFIYGTLLRGEPYHDRLAAVAAEIQDAVMPGAVLHNLGPFPMLRPGTGRVVGELVWLHSEVDEMALAELDTIEGVRRALYHRERRPVLLTGCGPLLEAWVYVGSEAIAEQYPVIPNGDWRQR
ncbi:MAG: gamma-glutamylcyclotransferase [Ardenticatenaceae bacterium]|nr:gamma-glutamylcyclotransferase [Ardenticatenaceae bacterium]HBY96365.1 hypothetical protein [Chloroflexota bacterium]